MTTLPFPEVLAPVADEFRLSYSAITTHRSCPQEWTYQYLMRLVPDLETSPAETARRDLGSWWHAMRAVDALRRGRWHGSLLADPGKISVTEEYGPVFLVQGDRLQIRGSSTPPLPLSSDTVLRVAQVWWNKAGETVREAWIAELGAALPVILEAMDVRWCNTWAEEIETERPLLIEVQGSRLLPGLEEQEVGGELPPPVLYGRADEVYFDTRRQLTVVRDTKSMGDIPTTSTLGDLMDSQLHLYAWIVEPALQEHGLDPQAVAYDRTRTKMPTTPVVTQAGTLSKSVTDYDLGTYLAWAAGPSGQGVPYPGRKADGSGAGLYGLEESVVEKLSAPAARAKWNHRALAPINRNLQAAHLQAAAASYRDMWATVRTVTEHGQATRNIGRWTCSRCDYQSLCLIQMTGGPEGEYVLSDHGLRRS